VLQLGKRKHGHSGGGGGGGEEGAPNGMLAWGPAKSGVLGGGYHNIDWYAYPQGVVGMQDVLQITSGNQLCALDRERKVHTVGGLAGGGRGTLRGEAVEEGGEAEEEGKPGINWFEVTGEYPQYPADFIKYNNREEPPGVVQPVGAPCVALPSKADYDAGRSPWYVLAVCSNHGNCLVLTSDGRVLAWGSNTGGQLGIGWKFQYGKAPDQIKEGKWPTYGPGWVQVGGPGPGTPDPRHAGVGTSEMLKDVIALAAAQETSWFLKSNGEVWYSGTPTGGGAPAFHAFAAKDPLWTPDPANKPIAIAATKRGYLLLLADGTPRYVGNITEYCAGDGTEVIGGSLRVLTTPLLADKSVPKNVIAIAKGDYSIKLLKDNGVAYTAGSNLGGQQGVGAMGEAQHFCVPMTSLNAGGRTVVAISGGGESTHGAGPEYLRLPGANGEDGYLYLLDDGSIRCNGVGWVYNTGAPERWEGVGAHGAGTSANHVTPLEPLGALRDIAQIAAGNVHQVVVQQPGTAAALTISPSVVSAGTVRVDWSTPATPGSLPYWRAEEGWNVTLIGLSTGIVYRSGLLAGNVRTFTFSGVASGQTYEVKVSATTEEGKPEVLGTPGVLSAALSTGAAITSLPFTPPEALLRGTPITVSASGHTQTFTVSADVELGATFVPIESATPNFAYPKGSVVRGDGAIKVAGTRWGTARWGVSAWGSGALDVEWADPPHTEPGFILEYQHRGTVPVKNAKPFTLSSPITAGSIVTGLAFTGLAEKTAANELVKVTSGGHSQVFTMAGGLAIGATSAVVKAALAAFSFPVGSGLLMVKREDWQRLEPDTGPFDRVAEVTIPPGRTLAGGTVTGEDVRVRVFGNYPGYYKTRIRELFVP
jgi:alpha-tubulin suppressor-like RCC1 family protein